MNITVKKFGGSSIESIELINQLASKLAKEKRQGNNIVVVVSAMAKTTDYLFSLANQISKTPFQRELDMLVTAGERISMSLLSIALHKNGVPAISFTGSQSGIITDNRHGNARIINVKAYRIQEELQKGKIVIVAGYQGVSHNKEVTTLGRGGSDTTAVALAGFLEAKKCEIYKDVDGVYSADPNKVSQAIKFPNISYKEIHFLASSGCKVIHPRAVEFAMKYQIPITIKSTFTDNNGSVISKEEEMKENQIKAITHKNDLLLYDVETKQLITLINSLSLLHIEIADLEILNEQHIRLIIEKQESLKLENYLTESSGSYWSAKENISSISFVGFGSTGELSFLTKILKFLDKKKINIFSAMTKPPGMTIYLKKNEISFLIDEIHRYFVLDNCN